MVDVAEEISTDLRTALEQDQLDLPSLPEVALRIRDEAESKHVSAVSLGRVVGEDPGLAAQLVRTANSPIFRATRSIDDVSQAISRLGVEYAANMVTGLAMQQMFQATSDLVDRKMRAVWKSSCNVAALSSIICKRYTKLRPDQATLAGLTHCIGVLPILGWIEEYDHVVQDSITLERVITTIHPAIGEMILRHWKFAEDIVCVPSQYQTVDRETVQVDYVDIVCAANLLQKCSFVSEPNAINEVQDPTLPDDWQSALAFERLGLHPQQLVEDEIEYAGFIADVDEVTGVLR